jgi:hypothetical protein
MESNGQQWGNRQPPYVEIAWLLKASIPEAREFFGAVKRIVDDQELRPEFVASILSTHRNVLSMRDPASALAGYILRIRRDAKRRKLEQGTQNDRKRNRGPRNVMPGERADSIRPALNGRPRPRLPIVLPESMRALPTRTLPGADAKTRRNIQLTWEVLPSGWWQDRIQAPVVGGQTSDERVRWMKERIDLLVSLLPLAWYEGADLGKRVYSVATFPGIAIADSGDYANALYYVLTNGTEWQSIFRRSKREALQLGARRVIHNGDWELRVRQLVRTAARRSQRG